MNRASFVSVHRWHFPVQGCRSCGARIFWVGTGGDKSMPIDAEPVKDGNIVIAADTPRALVFAPLVDDPEQMRFVSHFVSCPDADEWRNDR